MTPSQIACPRCGEPIALSDALLAQVRGTVETDLKQRHAAELQAAVWQAEARAKEPIERDLRLVREQLAEQQRKTQEAQQAELTLRKEKTALELGALPEPEEPA
ncbi:IncF plasmid conjugative transfer pilus assembly protein TraB [Nitrospira tepida]|uniref:IncF plasmid conjugative transfer pilus assembly protein TraB n=1 Tax=Nitrospira tepida TaxID=2973512 RepID=A0AA86MW33_9BACT|nr:hypothetical protein [Nitrospira tepida]CAI4030040.1 IncF plasmid conjugative transfer pilus assembly protein TraB [Nitrospira tepida]